MAKLGVWEDFVYKVSTGQPCLNANEHGKPRVYGRLTKKKRTHFSIRNSQDLTELTEFKKIQQTKITMDLKKPKRKCQRYKNALRQNWDEFVHKISTRRSWPNANERGMPWVYGCLKKKGMHFSIRNPQGLPDWIQTNSPITEDTHRLWLERIWYARGTLLLVPYGKTGSLRRLRL